MRLPTALSACDSSSRATGLASRQAGGFQPLANRLARQPAEDPLLGLKDMRLVQVTPP
jgi:hypothetical protein